MKQLVGNATVYVKLHPITTLTEIALYCKQKNITGVISTSSVLLNKLLQFEDGAGTPGKLNDYAGSYFKRDGIEYVFISPLEQLHTVPYGKFLARRFISKLVAPASWWKAPKFSWELLTPENMNYIFHVYSSAFAIAVDIETLKNPVSIRCISYTALLLIDGEWKTHTCVLPMDSQFNLSIMRKFNWELKAPKILQTGKYDISYLSRYNAVLYNYMWDTASLFHSWYSEMPKDLGFLSSFCLREARYWKDLSNTTDLMEYYRYNALDTWNTAINFLVLLDEMPTWARENYAQEFPLLFPCHLAEMTGLKQDIAARDRARAEVDAEIVRDSKSLDTMLGVTNFNVNSPVQMKALLKILGCGDLPSTDEQHLAKAAFRHPLNARIIDKILNVRGNRKLKSTYLRTDADITKTSPKGAKDFQGRILYALNPYGTDTGRLASREHHFWTGLQIQNIPRDKSVKQTIIADDGFMLCECDLEQAESRDTAHIAGDKSLIAAVTGVQDFHSVNASKFFGVEYEKIFDDKTRKVLDKLLRDLAKRVNHGANYNMGAGVLVDTMGLMKIYEAARLLGLPKLWTSLQIAAYLLETFHKTYPNIANVYYPRVIHDVNTTRKLVGATGWTRYCFSDPSKSKSALNAYVAHCPQSLNAMKLNKAWMKVFYAIAIHPVHWRNFKLCAQIHDSILFQIRIGHEYLIDMVRACMEIPVTVVGCDGKTRTYTVPAAIKAGKAGKGALYWNQTE